VYRSRFLLDEDLAARGAALGRIYRELGFQQQALVEGWKSLSQDPTDSTAHRLLSDSYSVLPRHEIARVSELLQSQLLQPINITPVQPQLAESDLFLLGGLGPAEPSLNEFNSLFQRDRFSLLASGLVGTQQTYSDEVVHSGIWNNLSYSLGQFHYETDGFRTNNDIDVNIYNALMQGRILPNLSVQAEFRHREVEHGDLNSRFAPTELDLMIMRASRQEADSYTYRAGVHFAPSVHSDLIGSFIYQDIDIAFGLGTDRTRFTNFTNDTYSAETQYIVKYPIFDAAVGLGYYVLDIRFIAEGRPIDFATEHSNAYVYTRLRYPRPMIWTLGVSVDWVDIDDFSEPFSSVNPKFGVLWNVTPNTVLRVGVFKTLRRFPSANQTIEPTQVAGFNQFFDDLDATESVRYGAGIDHRFSSSLSGGIEVSKRDLEIPVAGQSTTLDFKESLYRAYLNWTPQPRWVATLEYFKEDFDDLEPRGLFDTETQIVPLSVSYFDPSGLFGKLRVSYLDQEVALEAGPDSDGAAFLDLGLGYRLPKRWGIFEVQFQNLLDQDYRYQSDHGRRAPNQAGVPSLLPFAPELTVFARLTIAL
jgi:hypothetical protein